MMQPPQDDSARPPALSTAELMRRLRRSLPPPAERPIGGDGVPPGRGPAIPSGLWLDDLLRRYGPGAPPPADRRGDYWILAGATCVVAVAALSWSALSAAYVAAYPAEPTKREALSLCSAQDPTFVRFLAAARAGCYARMAPDLPGVQAANAR
jgi:hypothetical protein